MTTTPATPRRQLTGAALQARRARRIRVAVTASRAIVQAVMMVALAVIGIIGSYQHLRDLGIMAGQDARFWWSSANLTPISIDLMLVVASIQLRRKGITPIARTIARLCSLAGLIVSLGGNVLVAWLHLPYGSSALTVAYTLIWAAVPVASLLGATEMLTHTHKDRPTLSRASARKVLQRKAKRSGAQASAAKPVAVQA